MRRLLAVSCAMLLVGCGGPSGSDVAAKVQERAQRPFNSDPRTECVETGDKRFTCRLSYMGEDRRYAIRLEVLTDGDAVIIEECSFVDDAIPCEDDFR